MLDHASTQTEIREKYALERDKRIRKDANEQFVGVEGDFAYFAEDPYGEVVEREPLTDFTEAIVIGGGFGGLLQGARLRQAGYTDIRIIEKGSDFGGTWYWNRYPGVQCDIESYIYLPLLEETGFMPSHKYAFGDEIRRHCVGIAAHFGLYDSALFSTAVTSVDWDDSDQLWTVRTAEGDAMRARFVCMANGPLNRPKLPGVPGIDTFAGHTFHTSRWDYDYTGGDSDGGLTGLADKRVAVIGTGATALQCVPHVGASAQHLYVVQRTPSAVDERNNSETDSDWVESLEPGWQQERVDNFISLMSNRPEQENLVNDMWTDLAQRMRTAIIEGLTSGEITPCRRSRRCRACRLRIDASHSRSGGPAGRGPRRGRIAQALLPQVVQAPGVPRRVPPDLQPTERHARRHEGAGRRAVHRDRLRRRTARSTRSIASSSPPVSKSAPATPAAPATRSRAPAA